MQGRVLSPTLAFHEAREVCADLSAIFAASELSMAMPEGAPTGTQAHIPYDEQVRVRVHLRLPSLPSRLPPPREATKAVTVLDNESLQRLPPRLVALATSLQLRVQAAFLEEPTSPVTVYAWQGMEPHTDFCVRLPSCEEETPSSITPFGEDSGLNGIVYDTASKAWHMHWYCDLVMPWRRARGKVASVRINSDLRLRLDLGTLVAHADAPRPQTPFHYTAHSVHPCALSGDPYMIEADMLSELAASVKVPDETPEQRHKHLADQLTLLPTSMLMPVVLGSDIVTPWSEAVHLAQRVRRAKELEAAALASDADIALSSWTTPPKPAPGGMHRSTSLPVPSEPPAAPDDTVDVPTLALSGLVTLCRAAHLDVTVEIMLSVRIYQQRRLCPTPRGTYAMIVWVELENGSIDTPFVLHDVTLQIGSASYGGQRMDPLADADDVKMIVEPLYASNVFPMHIGPLSQHNLLYTVRIECAHMDVSQTAATMAAWLPCRHARVVLRGTPARGGEAAPSTYLSDYCASVYTGLAQNDLQRTMIAKQALRRAAGAIDAAPFMQAARMVSASPNDAPPPPPKPWRANSGLLRASEAPGAPTRRAIAWNQADVSTKGCVPGEMASAMASLHGALLAKVNVTQHAPTLGLGRALLHVSLFHLSTEEMDLEVQWHPDTQSASQGTVLPERPCVSLGRLAPGQSCAADLELHLLEAGYHVLGHIGVLNRATGIACVLQHVGAVYVATEGGSAAT